MGGGGGRYFQNLTVWVTEGALAGELTLRWKAAMLEQTFRSHP